MAILSSKHVLSNAKHRLGWFAFYFHTLCLLGCGKLTALDVTLVPDPNITSEALLLESLHTIKLVLDSPQGLYPKDYHHAEQEISVEDIDRDGYAELTARIELNDSLHLPMIRIKRGGLALIPLELRIDGISLESYPFYPNQAIAAGGVQGVRFVEDQVVPIKVPFNVRPLYRPPQVVQVFPEDGTKDLVPMHISSVLLIFSKQMQRDSLLVPGVFQVTQIDEDGNESLVKPKQIDVGQLYQNGPTKAEYQFKTQLPTKMTFRVDVSSKALDMSGRPLDQVPLEPGNQPFQSTFASIDTSGPQPAPPCPPYCDFTWCSLGGKFCAPGLVCNKAQKACEPSACPEACPEQHVCNPDVHACVVDCRINGTYGACPDGTHCEDTTGLCVLTIY